MVFVLTTVPTSHAQDDGNHAPNDNSPGRSNNPFFLPLDEILRRYRFKDISHNFPLGDLSYEQSDTDTFAMLPPEIPEDAKEGVKKSRGRWGLFNFL
eukprot:1378012-Amorphochlora_amoeboformis.AAC.1